MKVDFGGVREEVVTSDEFPLDRARQVLKNEKIAVIGYGVQGPAQAMNMRDNGLDVIVGQEPSLPEWDKAKTDGWVPGVNLFSVPEAVKRGTTVQFLVSDAAQKAIWPTHVKPFLTRGSALYFSHGFSIAFEGQTGVIPQEGIDVIMVAPKGPGGSVRENFKNKSGINSSYAVFQDATGRALDRTLALGIGIGSGYLFETNFRNEVLSDLVGERAVLLGELCALAEASYLASRNLVPRDPLAAFTRSSEQLTQVVIPVIGQEGADGIYNRAKAAQRLDEVLGFQVAARDAVRPLMQRLYGSVASGDETAVVLRANSMPDYRKRLDAELAELDGSEMWQAGKAVRASIPDRSYGGQITNFPLAGALLGIMEAQYELFIKKGHSPSEAFNETVEELTAGLNPIYKALGVAGLIGRCSTTAQRGALDWNPRFYRALAPVLSGPVSKHAGSIRKNYTTLDSDIPNIWQVGEAVRALRPENRKK